MTGIMYIIVFMPGICSCPPVGLLIFVVIIVEAVISSVKRLTWSPYIGMVKGRLNMESYVERSCAQRNDCCLSSMDAGKKRNMAKRIGICSIIGRHPPIGLTPAFL